VLFRSVAIINYYYITVILSW